MTLNAEETKNSQYECSEYDCKNKAVARLYDDYEGYSNHYCRDCYLNFIDEMKAALSQSKA
jgi:hypothetical protein